MFPASSVQIHSHKLCCFSSKSGLSFNHWLFQGFCPERNSVQHSECSNNSCKKPYLIFHAKIVIGKVPSNSVQQARGNETKTSKLDLSLLYKLRKIIKNNTLVYLFLGSSILAKGQCNQQRVPLLSGKYLKKVPSMLQNAYLVLFRQFSSENQ